MILESFRHLHAIMTQYKYSSHFFKILDICMSHRHELNSNLAHFHRFVINRSLDLLVQVLRVVVKRPIGVKRGCVIVKGIPFRYDFLSQNDNEHVQCNVGNMFFQACYQSFLKIFDFLSHVVQLFVISADFSFSLSQSSTC